MYVRRQLGAYHPAAAARRNLKGLGRASAPRRRLLGRLGDTCVIDPQTGGRVCTSPPNLDATGALPGATPLCPSSDYAYDPASAKCCKTIIVTPEKRRTVCVGSGAQRSCKVVITPAVTRQSCVSPVAASAPPVPYAYGYGYGYSSSLLPPAAALNSQLYNSSLVAAAAPGASPVLSPATSGISDFISSVPTWAWLAGGGALLFVVMGRR